MNYSTDSNLNNPTRVDEISLIHPSDDLSNSAMDLLSIKVVKVGQTFYDLMASHDPSTIYIIDGAKDKRFYFNDQLVIPAIENPNGNGKYFMGITSDNKFEIYQFINNTMIPISKYDNPQASINALMDLSKCIISDKKIDKVRNLLSDYVDKRISGLEMLIGIIIVSGKSAGHPEVIQFINNLKCRFPAIPICNETDSVYGLLCKLTHKITAILETYDWLADSKYSNDSSCNELINNVANEIIAAIDM